MIRNRQIALLSLAMILAACRPSSEKPPAAAAGTPALDVDSPPPASSPRDYEAMARELYRFEPDYEKQWPIEFHIRICEGLTQDLNRAIKDLGGNIGPDLFANKVELGWGTPGKEEPVLAGVRAAHWDHSAPHETLDALSVRKRWLQYLSAFSFVEHALLKIKTDPKIPAPGVFQATAALEILGRERSGGWRRDAGKVKLEFRRGDTGWRISKFVLDHFTTERRAEKMFEDVAAGWLAALPETTRERLRTRSASDEIHTLILHEDPLPGGVTLNPAALDARPGLAVVDFDRDGWDDVFVWDVRGPASLLRNVDGTRFEDVSAATGLDVRDVSAAAFADLDNDGFTDAVIGRWFGRSEIFLGASGPAGVTFIPADATRRLVMPSEVVSIAIADVNRDGGLDIFFGTADQEFHRRVLEEKGTAPRDWDAHVNQVGPPDLFLLNRGQGRFEDATRAVGLADRWRNSLAPSFADFDEDGWPDLFIGNDFAGSDLYVNEKGVFRSISDPSGANEVIYGMGASWGDVDNDGDLDLYASAMQSSAGKRIMSDEDNFARDLGENDRRARMASARGNTLLRNEGGRVFADATASGQPWSNIRGANWAYGAQLVDVDQDGWLDVFSPNGFFTSADLPEDGITRDL